MLDGTSRISRFFKLTTVAGGGTPGSQRTHEAPPKPEPPVCHRLALPTASKVEYNKSVFMKYEKESAARAETGLRRQAAYSDSKSFLLTISQRSSSLGARYQRAIDGANPSEPTNLPGVYSNDFTHAILRAGFRKRSIPHR